MTIFSIRYKLIYPATKQVQHSAKSCGGREFGRGLCFARIWLILYNYIAPYPQAISARVAHGRGLLINKNMTLKEAIDSYQSWKQLKFSGESHISILNQFCMFMRNCELEDISVSDVEEWLKMHSLLGYDQNTFVRKTTCLRAFFTYFEERGSKTLNPRLIPVPPQKYKLPRICDDQRYKQLLNSIIGNNSWDVRNRALIRMYWETGARNSEILSLNLQDLKDRRAIIKTEKIQYTFPYREIFWSEETDQYLKDWLKVREEFCKKRNIHSEAVFICTKGLGVGYRLTCKGVGEMLRRYSNLAGIEKINAHSMRHSFGRRLASQGANQATIMSLLGHSNDGSSSVYTRLYGNDLKTVHNKYIDKVKNT